MYNEEIDKHIAQAMKNGERIKLSVTVVPPNRNPNPPETTTVELLKSIFEQSAKRFEP